MTAFDDPPRAPLRVVFLSARSGGGHDGTAHAVAAWMERVLTVPVESRVVDVYGSRLAALPWMARIRAKSDVLWGGFVGVTRRPWVLRGIRTVMRPVVMRRLRSTIRVRPDLLVATHFVAAQCVDDLAGTFAPRPPTLVIATDYAPHPAWFGNADLTVLSRETGLAPALATGSRPERLFPVSLLPARPTPVRSSPASPPEGPCRLCAVMGADGTSTSRLRAVLQTLDASADADRFTVSVICGYNESLRQALTAGAWRLRHVRLEAVGYVRDVPQRLAEADAVLVRASPLVLTEALAAGRPVFAFDWHHHEAGGAALIEAWQVGRARRQPGTLVEELTALRRNVSAWRALEAGARARSREAFGEAGMREILVRLGLGANVTVRS